jgi:phosphomannomutase
VHADGTTEKLAMPASNVLGYLLDDGTRIIIRPSGTEPKLKYYIDHRETVAAQEPLTTAEERARAIVAAVDAAVTAMLHAASSI